ncbi:hypothetical protein Anapl_01050 [Anas platyrhynchos]|uniref:Uncharacterized protein n=1 Tax=Anas platyrhynchos TaxID=8839 RepID=R0M1Y7_ANAPL|nr:hypothetical protein Anapl_01050 [Anas platyrhynchos]
MEKSLETSLARHLMLGSFMLAFGLQSPSSFQAMQSEIEPMEGVCHPCIFLSMCLCFLTGKDARCYSLIHSHQVTPRHKAQSTAACECQGKSPSQEDATLGKYPQCPLAPVFSARVLPFWVPVSVPHQVLGGHRCPSLCTLRWSSPRQPAVRCPQRSPLSPARAFEEGRKIGQPLSSCIFVFTSKHPAQFGSKAGEEAVWEVQSLFRDQAVLDKLHRELASWMNTVHGAKRFLMKPRQYDSLSTAATCSRRAIAYPKLNLAAGRPWSLASSARITNQRATETDKKAAMKLLLSAYKEGEGQQGQQTRLSLQHAESPEVAWGERRASERLVPKQYEAAEPAEVTVPKWNASTCVLAQQGSAAIAEKGTFWQRKGPPEPVEVDLPLGKVPACGRPKRSSEPVYSKPAMCCQASRSDVQNAFSMLKLRSLRCSVPFMVHFLTSSMERPADYRRESDRAPLRWRTQESLGVIESQCCSHPIPHSLAGEHTLHTSTASHSVEDSQTERTEVTEKVPW